MREYTKIQGTADIQPMYNVDATQDVQLKNTTDLNTFDKVKDWAPALANWWEYRGFPLNRITDMYKLEAGARDFVQATDTYMGIGLYNRPNGISQSRATIIFPHGWFRFAFGAPRALGLYTGKHPNVYSDRTKNASGAWNNPGCTPGTCFEVDHANWMVDLQPIRTPLHSTAWNSDYATSAGMAYEEGSRVEYIRFEGGMNGRNYDPSFQSWGTTSNEPGENSYHKGCMFANWNDGGVGVYGGTPTIIDNCSFFYNIGGGIDLLCNNSLSNILLIQPTGDNNRDGLIRLRPRGTSDVSGANLTIISSKLEARQVLHRLVVVKGTLGQLNLSITGGTNDFSGIVCDQLISVEKGTGVAVDIRSLNWSSGMQSIYYNAETRKRVTGGMAFRGNSIGFTEDEGIFLRSRQNMVMVTSGTAVGAPVVDSFTSNPSSIATTTTVTLSWQTTDATEVRINGALQSAVDGSGTFTAGPNTTTFTLEAKNASGAITTRSLTVAVTTPAGGNGFDRIGWTVTVPSTDGVNVKERMLDNSLTSFWMGLGGSMDGGDDTVTVDMKRVNAAKGVRFNPNQYYVNSWPKKFRVLTAGEDQVYTDRGIFQGAFNAAAMFPSAVNCRYIQVKPTEGNMGNWWNIADFVVLK